MPLSPEQLASLTETAGETRTKGPSIETKTIRFNGSSGDFRMIASDGSPIPLDKPLKIVVLKKRLSLQSFGDAWEFTSEYEFTSTIINLFSKVGNARATFVDSDTAPNLRTRHTNLKTVQNLYVLYEGELCKLEVKGGSLHNFIEYQQKLSGEGLHSYQVVTSITTEAGKKGAISFNSMVFDYEDIDEELFGQVQSALKDVTAKLYEIDRYYAEKNAKRLPETTTPGLPTLPDTDIPYPTEAIDPDDIPF